jgi:ABC-type uncharacterized transport system substrate-binding protein
MRRREFIILLGGTAAWPLGARAQQPERMRRIGILLPAAEDHSEYQARVGVFLQGLAQSGWTIGRNVRIDTRWATTNHAELRRHAEELVALAPDVVLAPGASALGPLLQATRSVPIVFPFVIDPVGAGFVDSLARPGGNATGFMAFEYSLSGKWLELLKQIAPGVTRAAVFRDPTQGGGTSQFAVIQAVAPSLRMEVTPVNMRDAGEIEHTIAAFAGSSNAGLVMTSSRSSAARRRGRSWRGRSSRRRPTGSAFSARDRMRSANATPTPYEWAFAGSDTRRAGTLSSSIDGPKVDTTVSPSSQPSW